MRKKECIAMLLAGGQGSRLLALTKKNAKPAVSFGGKYRIIDFSLSNCVSSGIDTVGVLTQYKPTVLNSYLSNGEAWDLDCSHGGVHVLPPYETENGGSWYLGTADAIYHNIDFIDSYSPEYVLILSGDHLYTMDYSKMLRFHKENQADLTVSVMTVPWEEASRFGIMECDDQGQIVDFAEKPQNPVSNLASMGIYIFSWPVLREALLQDHEDKSSSHDFGKNIIPVMLSEQKRLFAYEFSGYWKDVGTIRSLWDANMDMLDPISGIELYDESWPIYARSPNRSPHFTGPQAEISHSLVTGGCEIYGKAADSVLFYSVVVEEGAYVHSSVLMPGAHVKAGARVEYSIVAENAVIGENAVVGACAEEPAIAVIASGVHVAPGAQVPAGAMITEDVKGGEEA